MRSITVTVLEVYRITLLSNSGNVVADAELVLEVYRITLLSNRHIRTRIFILVLEVYRITLLSNEISYFRDSKGSFRGLQNYTTLKPNF